MTPIRTPRLLLRNWEERDRDLFHRVNSDDRVMAFFPFRRTRAESDALMDRLREMIAGRGYGFAPIELAETQACIGFAGLHPAGMEPQVPAGSVEVGWRLAPEFWGQGFASEAARAWLGFGFVNLGLPEIVSFAVHDNSRSIAVMERIGMSRVAGGDFDHPGVPATQPRLRPHVLYRLTRSQWMARPGA